MTAVTPEPVPLRSRTRFAIAGSGFGDAEGQIELAGAPVRAGSWTATAIVAEIRPRQYYPVSDDSVLLEVRSAGAITSRKLSVQTISVTRVDPPSIKAKAGEVLTVIGSGFLTFDRLEVVVAGVPAVELSRADTQMQIELRAGAYTPGNDRRVTVTAYPDATAPLGTNAVYTAQAALTLT